MVLPWSSPRSDILRRGQVRELAAPVHVWVRVGQSEPLRAGLLLRWLRPLAGGSWFGEVVLVDEGTVTTTIADAGRLTPA